MSVGEKRVLIEHVGDDFGVTVRYEMDQYARVRIDFFAAEIIGRADDGTKYYSRKGAASSTDDTDDFSEAERLVSGSVKWDGCSHYYFGDEEGYLHMHGAADLEKFGQALVTIYERCGELMKEHGGNLLEGEFKVA